MASPSSSSSSSVGWMYDVFLSFRGETRKSFIDHLYANLCQAGVNTFRDDERIQKGENISAELLKAIEGSKISIIVFSKTYARSRWCLDELVKVLECKQNLRQMVLPIFYDVDPSEVRKQTGEFGDALTQHRERYGNQKVDEWKAALTTAANLSGWDLQTMANGYESKFIKKITEEVLRKVNPTYINVAKYPVGIDSHVRDILHLLQSQTNDDVKMIGIFGMGGVGKTTLAKAIYNLSFHRFEGSCFIANIRSEVSGGQHNGLVRLQEKLVCETLKRKKIEIDNVDKGISLIKERLRSKKILIVLDDIDHISQLESLAGQRDWFGSGSIIIITTRDFHLLRDLGAHEKYKVDTLSTDESLQLLSWHAFGVPAPLEDYAELSKKIASYTGGLPLALTVIGSHLRGRSVQEWSYYAEKLKRIPHDDVQKILKISYDALDDDTQNIFLDIASFFIGHNKNNTAMILEACGFYAESGIKTLIERCLLTINEGGEFGRLEMHDLVQDMGKEIVRKESPREPGKRSRLIDPNDVFDVLQGNKGTEAIEGMIVNSNMLKNVPLSTKVFTRMVNLRILILDGVCLRGSFKYLSNELRVFRLHNCGLSHIQSDFCFEKLAELDLQDTNIKEFRPNMKHFKCLKILKLIGCKQLKKTPDFTGAQSLQELVFLECPNLVQVHPSIGRLERLVELYFDNCKKLKELPSSICKLKSLELFNLNFCQKLKELPIDLGKLEQLRELHALGTAVSHIPFSLRCLGNLKILNLGEHMGFDASLVRQSETSGLLPSKSKSQLLDILSPHFLSSRTRDPVGFFPKNYLHEVDLPIDLGSSSSLRILDLSRSCYLQSLPFSLCHLSNLKCLYLNYLQNLRALLELPPSLEILVVQNCFSLEKIADISNLKRLKELTIWNCKSLVELPGLESLESLEMLDITSCNALTIPHNYLHEITLGISSSLTYLDLNNGSFYLQSLPFCLCHLSNLKSLYLDYLLYVRELLELPPNLEFLSAQNCVSLEKIADISNLKRLRNLNVRNCKSLVELPGLESLESLEVLDITNCIVLTIPYNYLHEVDLPTVLGSLSSLKELYLIGRCYLQSLPLSLCHHSNLKELYLDDWQNLKTLTELPPTLNLLSTRNCVSLEKIAHISSLKRLENLYIGNCKNMVELPSPKSLESLWSLEITNCSGLSIPLIENWFQAHTEGEGDSVKITFSVYREHRIEGDRTHFACCIPTLLRHGRYLNIWHNDFHLDDRNVVGVTVRSKTTGAWILKNGKYNKFDIMFEVPTVIGEVLEVYADFHPALQRLSLFEIHRNRDGEVHFFPSTRGFVQFH